MTDQCGKSSLWKIVWEVEANNNREPQSGFSRIVVLSCSTRSVCKCQGSASYSCSLGSRNTILIKCEWTDQRPTLTSLQLALRCELHLTDKTQIGFWVLCTAPLLPQCRAGVRAAGWLGRACVRSGMGWDVWVWYTVSVLISQLWSFDFLLQYC